MKKVLNQLLITLLFIILALGQFEKLYFFYFHDVLILLILLINFRSLGSALKNNILKFGWLFGLVAIISFLVNLTGKSQGQLLLSLAYLLRWLGYYAFLGILIEEESLTGRWTEKIVFWYSIIVAVLALGQFVFFPDMRSIVSLGYDDHYYRAIGNVLDPNYLGLILVLGLLYQLKNIGWRFKKSLAKVFPNIILVIIIIIPLLLTYSRASYLALFVGLIFLFNSNYRLKIIMFALACWCIFIFLVPKPTGEGGNLWRKVSINTRWLNYQRSIEIIKDRPVLGVGFNNYRFEQEKRGFIPVGYIINSASGADNSFLFIAATTGIVGLIVFLLQLVKFWQFGGSPLLKSSLAAVVIHSFFNNSIFYSWIILWLWVIIGLTYRHSINEKK